MSQMRAIVIAWLIFFPLLADVVEQGPKDSAPSGLLAGVARADITPPVGIAHLNWGSQTHVEAVGIDPVGMYATALALSDGTRSEEHTSELQSLAYLVCRLLLEKKNQHTDPRDPSITYDCERRTV